jgi:hypothetical protein
MDLCLEDLYRAKTLRVNADLVTPHAPPSGMGAYGLQGHRSRPAAASSSRCLPPLWLLGERPWRARGGLG